MRRLPQQSSHLLGGYVVSIFFGMDPPDIHRGYSGVPDEADLGDELVGPAGDDGLAR